MHLAQKKFHQLLSGRLWIRVAFFLTLSYWFYLMCTVEMLILDDAIGYESLGKLIYQSGWKEYLTTGPHREPLYPFLVALSMSLADKFHVSYQSVQILAQFALLFLTQWLVFSVLRKLRVRDTITALTILYLGFSPAMTNSALRLYSEILTFPLVLGIIVHSENLWSDIYSGKTFRFSQGAVLAVFFLLLTLIKGIFELITPIFLLLLIMCLWKSFLKQDKHVRKQLILFLALFMMVYFVPVNLYKAASKQFNGQYTLTDRGPWALYGNTARRTEPLGGRQFLIALSYVPGWGTCHAFFGPQACAYWSYTESDKLGAAKREELKQKYPAHQEQANRQLIALSVQKALHNPLQYALFASLEGLKLVFWDSVAMAHAIYPEDVMRVYDITALKLAVFFVIPIVTMTAIGSAIFSLWRNRHKIFTQTDNTSLILIILLFLLIYISCHAIFYVDPRYSFSLAPLYLILIANMFHRLTARPHHPPIGTNTG